MGSKRMIVWLLCAFVVAVSLDTVPDPPAVKDTYKFENPISGDHLQALPLNVKWDRPFSPFSYAAGWNAVVYVAEPDHSGNHHARLWRSTDSSPPLSIL
jgi:hypothetical protein